jgi:hypothetical protein
MTSQHSRVSSHLRARCGGFFADRSQLFPVQVACVHMVEQSIAKTLRRIIVFLGDMADDLGEVV